MMERRARFLQMMLTAAIVAVLLYRQHLMVLNEDVIWLLVQAGRLLDGGHFGTDFIEINTPPALLLYVPAALLQRALGLSMANAHLAVTSLEAVGLVAIMAAILRPTLTQRSAGFLLWPIVQVTVLAFALQAYHFGQRDCIVVLLLLPFLAQQSVRSKGEPPARWLQGVAGALAALAVAVKPHYAPLLIVLFLLRWRHDGFWRSLLAADFKVLVLVAIGLAAFSFILFPEWFGMVRFAWRFYRPEGRPLALLLSDLGVQRWPVFAVLLIALILWFRLPKTMPLRPFLTYLLIATPCLLISYLLQGRGYAYHLISFELAVELAAFLAILSVLMRSRLQAAQVLLVSLALLGLSLLGIRTVLNSGLTAAEMMRNPVIASVTAQDRGRGMVIFDTVNTPAVFAAALAGTEIAARMQNIWLLKSAVALADTPAGRENLEAIEAGMVADFQRFQPDLVVVNPSLRLADGRDVLSHLTGRTDFAAIWRGYQLVQAKIATDASGNRMVDIYARR
jgi:hypothetical protein